MSTQHTKGPWKFGSSNDDSVYKRNIGGSDGYHVAVASSREDDEVDANARLIAAAPDLLEALREAEAGLEFAGADKLTEVGGFAPAPLAALRIVRAAIAKATGETK